MKKLIILSLLLSGCASMDEYDRAWYVMHAVDIAQTYQISRSNCHHESGDAQMIIGNNPDGQGVMAWGIATAVAYNQISGKLPRWAKHVSVGYKGFTVSNNNKVGLGVSSSYCNVYDAQYNDYWMQ